MSEYNIRIEGGSGNRLYDQPIDKRSLRVIAAVLDRNFITARDKLHELIVMEQTKNMRSPTPTRPCPECHGRKRVVEMDADYQTVVEPCPDCGGAGTMDTVDKLGDTLYACPTCHGTGKRE